VVVAVLIAGGAGLAYYYVVRPAMGAVNAAKDLAQIQQIEARVRDKSNFAAPSDGVLVKGQVDRYLNASRSILTGLEGRLSQLQNRYEQIDAEGRDPNLRELATAYADILRRVVEAKKLQVDALNANDFSLAEYGWVRGQVLRAAGFETVQVDLAALANDDPGAALRQVGGSVPATNVEL